jgi:transcriptional regulator NrdR family protein
MDCVASSADTRVVDTRPVGDAVRRRRECLSCRERFTTWERADPEADEVERTVLAFVLSLGQTEEVAA